MFYKVSKYDLLATREIEYNDIAFGRPVGYVADATDTGGHVPASGASKGAAQPLVTGIAPPPMVGEKAQAHVRDCVGVLTLLRAKPNASTASSAAAVAAAAAAAVDGDADTSALAAAATAASASRVVLVASTHLFWDPQYADVKLAQADRLLAEAGHFLSDHADVIAAAGGGPAAVVIAGDFNSVPGSEVHMRMLRGIDGGWGDDSGAGEDGGDVRGRGAGNARDGGGAIPLHSAYASALAHNRILGGAAAATGREVEAATEVDVGGGGGGAGQKRGWGDAEAADAAASTSAGVNVRAAKPVIGSHGEPAHTNVTPR